KLENLACPCRSRAVNIESPQARASRGRVAAATFGRLCRPKVVKISRIPKRKTCHRQVFLFGAADEARTRYLHLGKVALYQMSYGRTLHVPCRSAGPATSNIIPEFGPVVNTKFQLFPQTPGLHCNIPQKTV